MREENKVRSAPQRLAASIAPLCLRVLSVAALFLLPALAACDTRTCGDGTPCVDPGETATSGASVTTSKYTLEADCGGHKGTFCVAVQLKDGAKLKPFVGSSPVGPGADGCRGWANGFTERTVAEFTKVTSPVDGFAPKDALVLLSGSTHDDAGHPAFPVKLGENSRWIATNGYECRAVAGAQNLRMLMIRNSEGRVFIEPFDEAKFKATTSAPEIVVGLDPSWNARASDTTGRHFVGLLNPHNGGYGTAVFVVAPDASGLKSSQAIAILSGKGVAAQQMLQLDGSTVAQLSVRQPAGWIHPIHSARQMPQVFGVF
jgi:hypothetical protein